MDTSRIKQLSKEGKNNIKLPASIFLLLAAFITIITFVGYNYWSFNNLNNNAMNQTNIFKAQSEFSSAYDQWLNWKVKKSNSQNMSKNSFFNMVNNTRDEINSAQTLLVQYLSQSLTNRISNSIGLINNRMQKIFKEQSSLLNNKNKTINQLEHSDQKQLSRILSNYKIVFKSFNSLNLKTKQNYNFFKLITVFYAILMMAIILALIFIFMNIQKDYRVLGELLHYRKKDRKAFKNLISEADQMSIVKSGNSYPVISKRFSVDRQHSSFRVSEKLNFVFKTIAVILVNVENKIKHLIDKKMPEYSENTLETINRNKEIQIKVKEIIDELKTAYDTAIKNQEKIAELYDIEEKNRDLFKSTQNSLNQLISKNNSINDLVQESSKKIKRAGESTQNINYSISSIKQISKKINVLALNTAIQATNGQTEQDNNGRFSIIAQDLESLSTDLFESTEKIENYILDLGNDTRLASNAMENAGSQIIDSLNSFQSNMDNLRKIKDEEDYVFDELKQLKKWAQDQIDQDYQAYDNFEGLNSKVEKSNDQLDQLYNQISHLQKLLTDSLERLKMIDKD